MAKKIQTVEEKLKAIYTLQIIDSSIDRIRTVRGELPLEVRDLESEIEGLTSRKEKIEDEIREVENSVSDRKNLIAESKNAIVKYKEQQDNVRNNREFDSLSKEIEFQELEIQLCEKRMKEAKLTIQNKQEVLAESVSNVDEKLALLELKNKELSEIIAEHGWRVDRVDTFQQAHQQARPKSYRVGIVHLELLKNEISEHNFYLDS